jgi:hypothetical protein
MLDRVQNDVKEIGKTFLQLKTVMADLLPIQQMSPTPVIPLILLYSAASKTSCN